MRLFNPNKSNYFKLTLAFLSLLSLNNQAVQAQASPKILLLATGGTIAGVANGNSVTGYDAGKVKVEDMVSSIPGLDDIAEVHAEQICNIASQDMNDKIWLKLSQRINYAFDKENYDGVVITHGTDTMEETAFFLDHAVKSRRPVVMVGSMRPTTAISPDGAQNLLDAIQVAADPATDGKGALIAFSGQIFETRNVTKQSTLKLAAFGSTRYGNIGNIETGKVYYEGSLGKNDNTPYIKMDYTEQMPRVDIIFSHANMDGSLIDSAVKNGAKGIVLAGVGDGNTSESALKALKRAVEQGIIVVRSTRVFNCFVHRNHEFSDDDYGFIVAYDLSPAKARIMLQMLMQSKNWNELNEDRTKLQSCFAE